MKIRSLVAGHYQLESSSSKNAELVEKLLHGYNFMSRLPEGKLEIPFFRFFTHSIDEKLLA
jgi:hypothetical protein